jgi:hypothetical protein
VADPADSPAEDECTPNDVWVYLQFTIGLTEHRARTELLAAFRAGDLRVRHIDNGDSSMMEPSYWDHLTLEPDHGRLVVRPLHFALTAGEHRYMVSWRSVRKFWSQPAAPAPQPEEHQEPAAPAPQPVAQEPQPPAAPAVAEQPAANQSPAEYFNALCQTHAKNRGEPKTQWAKRLHPLMMDAFDRGLIIGKRWSESTILRSFYVRK